MSKDADRMYLVPAMSCDHCRVAITSEVERVAGVGSIDVNLDEKTVRVIGRELDDSAIVAAIHEAGYDAVIE